MFSHFLGLHRLYKSVSRKLKKISLVARSQIKKLLYVTAFSWNMIDLNLHNLPFDLTIKSDWSPWNTLKSKISQSSLRIVRSQKVKKLQSRNHSATMIRSARQTSCGSKHIVLLFRFAWHYYQKKKPDCKLTQWNRMTNAGLQMSGACALRNSIQHSLSGACTFTK